MNNRQAFRWKKKHLIPIVSILLLIAMCLGISWRTQGVVTRFDPADYLANGNYSVFTPHYNSIYDIQYDLPVVDALERRTGVDENGNLKAPDANRISSYGVCMVVRVKGNENCLITYNERMVAEELSNFRTYDRITETSLAEISHSKTEVEILDVLYQTAQTHYQTGQQTTVMELYHILDKRVPQALEPYTDSRQSHMIQPHGWQPMEQGETYIIFGQYNMYPADTAVLNGMVLPYLTGIYCLSDLEKQAGYPKNAETLAANLAYLWQTYPEIMEKYADK